MYGKKTHLKKYGVTLAYLTLCMQGVVMSVRHSCTMFFGAKQDGAYFCQVSNGRIYTCARPVKAFPVTMNGCIPYYDIDDFSLGPAPVAPMRKQCDAVRVHRPRKQLAYANCVVLQHGQKEAYRCEVPKVSAMRMEECTLIQDPAPHFDIEFYIDG
ncbi:secreted protein [Melampsora americana]|nr:secreted protein [Melampsora americana]